MNELQIFKNEAFGKIRTITVNDKSWLSAKDVCDCLDIKNSRQAVEKLDDDEKFTTVITNDSAATGVSKMTFISEEGVYGLTFVSRKEGAAEFRRWLKHEVIPSIRKHGLYATEDVLTNMIADPDAAIKLFTALKDEREARIKAESKNALLQPKADFYDRVVESDTALDIGKVAKVLGYDGIGRNNLFKILREEGWLMDNNAPYQEYVNRGYFRVIEYDYHTKHGETKVNIKTLVYQKGIDAIRKMLDGRQVTMSITIG